MNEASEHSVVLSERALKQRERILEAARACFVKRTFCRKRCTWMR